MAPKRKYDIEFRVRLPEDLKEVMRNTAEELEISESDVMRMLLRTLKNKGLSILS